MSPVLEDPRNYVRLKQVNNDQVSLNSKVTARNLQHYALASPDRSVVFKQNYDRRFRQFNSRGFRSLPWRPYEVLGQPLKLDVKKLVLTTLGQDDSRSASSEGSAHNQNDKQTKTDKKDNNDTSSNLNKENENSSNMKKRNFSSASFVMRHRQQDKLRNIGKDLKYVGNTKSNVKVGKALFPMLQYDMDYYENKKAKEQERPKTTPCPQRKNSTKPDAEKKTKFEMVEPNQDDIDDEEEKEVRPFAPVYANISSMIDDDATVTKSIWKQLCVLHWLLYACNIASNPDGYFQHKTVVPLACCWNKTVPGGSSRDSRVIQIEQRSNSKWNKFARSASYHKNAKTKSRKRMSLLSASAINNNISNTRRSVANNESEAMKRLTSEKTPLQPHEQIGEESTDQVGDLPINPNVRPSSPGQSSISTTVAGGVAGSDDCGEEDPSNSQDPLELEQTEDGEESVIMKDNHENLNKLLSTVEVSVTSEMKRRKKISQIVAEKNKKIPISVYDWARSDYFKIGNEMVNISKIVVPTATDEPEPSTQVRNTKRPHTVGIMSKRMSAIQTPQMSRPGSRASPAKPRMSKPSVTTVRPRSSPAKLLHGYTFEMRGEQKRERLRELSEKFHEVNDGNALQLHNRLTELAKKRRDRMEVKFESFTPTISLQRDLLKMRSAAYNRWMEESMKQKLLDDQFKSSWFEKLKGNIPKSCLQDEDCSLILQRLQQLGAEMSRDERIVTSEAFLNTLRSLRRWELCSPEVLGAVEFLLQEIVDEELTNEEFDEWFAMKVETRKVQPPVGCDSKNIICQL